MSELESKKMALLKIIEKLSTKVGGDKLLTLAQDVLEPSQEPYILNPDAPIQGDSGYYYIWNLNPKTEPLVNQLTHIKNSDYDFNIAPVLIPDTDADKFDGIEINNFHSIVDSYVANDMPDEQKTRKYIHPSDATTGSGEQGKSYDPISIWFGTANMVVPAGWYQSDEWGGEGIQPPWHNFIGFSNLSHMTNLLGELKETDSKKVYSENPGQWHVVNFFFEGEELQDIFSIYSHHGGVNESVSPLLIGGPTNIFIIVKKPIILEQNIVLTNINLYGYDFTDVNLTGATLTGVASGNITGTPSAMPTDYSLIGGYIVGPDVDLTNANLTNANLDGANLSGADLTGALLDGAYLIGANLTGADLDGAYLIGALLDGLNLSTATLTGAILTDASLTGAILTGANLDGAILTNANLSGANFDGVVLGGTDLTGVNLTNANLDGATLTGADLTGANLDGATLTGANLDGVISGNITGTPTLPTGYELVDGVITPSL